MCMITHILHIYILFKMLFVFTLTHSVLVALALIRSTFGMDIKKKGYLLLRECHAFPAQEKINEVTPKPHPVVKK